MTADQGDSAPSDEAAFDELYQSMVSPLSPDHAAHQRRALAEPPPELPLLDKALFALAFGLVRSGQPWEITFDNELGTVACLSRAFSNIKAATALTLSGYYTEVEPLLRSAYESASLGRMLAHEPETAERWLREQEWIPDGRVRKWIKEHRGEDQRLVFAEHYKNACDGTHPTAKASLRSIRVEEAGWRPRLAVDYDDEAIQVLLHLCLATAAFACACLRNAAAVPEALPDGLGRLIDEVLDDVAKLAGEEPAPSGIDWETVEKVREAALAHCRAVDELEEELEANPRSWHNLRRTTSSDPAEE